MIGISHEALERLSKHQKLTQDGDTLIKRIQEIDAALAKMPASGSALPGVQVEEQRMILTNRLELERNALCERFHAIFLPKPQGKPELKVVRPETDQENTD